MLLLFGTACNLNLFMHVLRGGAGGCAANNSSRHRGALEHTWPLSVATSHLQGELLEETTAQREAILAAIDRREAPLNQILAQRGPREAVDGTPKTAAASLELQVGGIRRWVRGPTWQREVLRYVVPKARLS